MHYLATLSAFAAAATSVQALGSAYIINRCSFDTYLWTVDAERNPSTPITIKSGSTWSEGYRTPSAGGVSLKISKTTKCSPVTQLEYTVQAYSGNNFVWYDGSNVDCTGTDCPFQAHGLELTTSKGAACPQRNCTAGALTCPGFYTLWNDDENSLSCDDSADTLLTLCAQSGSSSGSGSSSSYGSSATAPAVSSTPALSVSHAPSTTAAPVYTMEAVVTTMVTVTHTRKARAVHNHARHHIE